MKTKNKQKTLGISPRGYLMVKALADANRRKIIAQIELLAEEECRRSGIKVPTEMVRG